MDIDETGTNDTSRVGNGAPGPLAGVRVLDFTRVLSGPHCTRMMADMGAEIIKVEPPDGDMTRFANPRVNGLSSYFVQQNTGKRNVSLDMKQPEALELLLRLAEQCDVVVENFRPGVATRMGLGYEAIKARNPKIVYASLTGYGASGPWVHRRAYAPVIGAEAGLTRAQGDARAHGEPAVYANDPQSHADVYTGIECASAILAALFQRERTGQGTWIDISMAQTMLYVNEHLHDQLWHGPEPVGQVRSFQPGDYPVLTAANGETVIVSGHPAERGTFDRYVIGLGRPELTKDPRFVDVPARLANLPQLLDELQAMASGFADALAIEVALDPQGLATGQLRTARGLADTEWAADRNAIATVSDRNGGTIRIPNPPWKFSSGEVGVRGQPRYRGEDNRDVLATLLGLSAPELDALDASGVLSSRVPDNLQ